MREIHGPSRLDSAGLDTLGGGTEERGRVVDRGCEGRGRGRGGTKEWVES